MTCDRCDATMEDSLLLGLPALPTCKPCREDEELYWYERRVEEDRDEPRPPLEYEPELYRHEEW